MSEPETFPTLPQGHKRFTVEQLLIELGPAIGLRSGALHALLHMMKMTAPGDWIRPDREPIFFAPQDVTAASLGKTRRALFNNERTLEGLGLIERRVKGNGHRSPYGGCGIVFSKLIALVPDLLNLVEQLRNERTERRALRNRRSTFARHARRLIEEIGPDAHPDVRNAEEALEGWPDARVLESMAIDALIKHVEDAKQLCETLDTMVEDRRRSSTEAAENFHCYIQENNQETPYVSCNASVQEKSGDKKVPENLTSVRPYGSKKGLGDKCEAAGAAHKAQFVQRLNPDRLFQLASNDMRRLIEDSKGGSPVLREIHLIDAAVRMLPYLGINRSAWEDAIEAMGESGAALSVLLLDANRFHPMTPVRNPGGALRAMTARHRKGMLNLVGSFIGLARRKNV